MLPNILSWFRIFPEHFVVSWSRFRLLASPHNELHPFQPDVQVHRRRISPSREDHMAIVLRPTTEGRSMVDAFVFSGFQFLRRFRVNVVCGYAIPFFKSDFIRKMIAICSL